MAIILKNVEFAYNRKTPYEKKVLENINLEIPDGTFLGICGNSGSGKTTLIKLIAGILHATSGTVQTNGQKIGTVFQNPENQLFEETALKDVMFGALNCSFSASQAQKSAQEALKSVGLDNTFENRSIFGLSGGEKRKVAIAGILAMNNDVLIFDEPTAGLDKFSQNNLFCLLRNLHKNGKTVIVVSHNLDALAENCSQIMRLENGKIANYGSPYEVFSQTKAKPFIFDFIQELRNSGFAVPQNIHTQSQLFDFLAT